MSGLRSKLVRSPIGLVCFRCGVRLTVLHFCAVCRVPLCGRCQCCMSGVQRSEYGSQ
jgi:hypothetical protein